MLTVAIVSIVGLIAVGPAGAKQPERGDQTMVLNEDPATLELGFYGCSEISWFGSVEIDDTTYGMALYPLPGRVTADGKVFHYEEGWKIWTEEFTLSYDDVAERYNLDDCEPGDNVLSGTDSGVWTAGTGKFRSNGVVEDALDPFDDWLGRHVHQDGVIGPIDFGPLDGVLGFYGDLRLN
jgi:hypothetical protein